MLLDDVGGSRVRSRARSRVGSHDHGSRDLGVIIDLKNIKIVIINIITNNIG